MINIITNEITNETCHIGYYPNCFNKSFILAIKKYCANLTDFRGGSSGWGKPIPRLQKWYQTEGYSFSRDWKSNYERWNSFAYDTKLYTIQDTVNQKVNELIPETHEKTEFNSCLINYYRDGMDSIKPHYDSTEIFGKNPVIGILSVGETRDIVFSRRKYNPDNPKSLKLDKINTQLNAKISLTEGSLLIMSGATQKFYVHEIPKVNENKNSRYSLTFRQYLNVVR